MSVFTPIRINKNSKVHYSAYIKTENDSDEAAPAEPATPATPEEK